MKILMTGGPVFEYLDSVKIITNKFKGGRMAALADKICDLGPDVYYLCSKDSIKPETVTATIPHDGFADYKDKVLSMAPKVDAIVLGAAVANLIPNTPWKTTKFPSHLFKEGDKINIEFMIAPRIINMIKPIVPRTTLIGFKLLSNVLHDELIDAAYTTLVESNANFIIANDTVDLNKKFIVTKEKSIIPLQESNLPNFIVDAVDDKYYSTHSSKVMCDDYEKSDVFNNLCNKYEKQLMAGYDNKRQIFFGCVAVREEEGFIISTRGKKKLNDITHVINVDRSNLKIEISGLKASLNAPLIDNIFKKNSNVDSIVHYHGIDESLVKLPYAFPGTIKDSVREIPDKSFYIEYHGTFLLLDKERNVL
ncbi:MAG: phosphopantothenoylcysteine decarboxylase [Patescibacteria group bacterium]